MSNSQEQIIDNFLQETVHLVQRANELNKETIVELYDMYEEAANAATTNILMINPELRVEICRRLDILLDYIVDFEPFDLGIYKPAGVFTPAVQGYRKWSNTELMKDKGLTGYVLAKTLNSHHTMYFEDESSDYPYQNVLPDQEIILHNFADGCGDEYYKHLNNNYKKMDLLVLHGMYEQTMDFLDAYRKLRPDGKVYCRLDMNSYWMNNIPWDNKRVVRFTGQCNLLANAGSFLCDTMNRNKDIKFNCRWFPTGLYFPAESPIEVNEHIKENVILTVSRIGSKQKNNWEMLAAFAQVSHIIKNWTLRLVGPIEPEFQAIIQQFYKECPDLKNRVTFTGPITDKNELYKEYAKAKIFILTSVAEGFPNVYPEALHHGCMFITSNIDAACDITNFGELGIEYKLRDMKDLTNAIVTLCGKADTRGMKEHIPKALAHAKRYYDWERNGRKLAYMLYGPKHKQLKPPVQKVEANKKYDKAFYDRTAISSYNSAKCIIPLVVDLTGPLDSVLDLGCGLGVWLSAFKETSVSKVMGVDGAYVDINKLYIKIDEFVPYDLDQPLKLNKKFSLVMSLEVAEHIPQDKAQTFINSLCNHGDVILFSAAPPGQGGTNHVNENWPSYWAALFANNGYVPFDVIRKKIWRNKSVSLWYRQNILMFAKTDSNFAQIHTSSNQPLDIVHPDYLRILNHNLAVMGMKPITGKQVNDIIYV
ncbi:MAG: glycosyltransferase [Defluviitaleaceae bacterium]|nr:glycosyltransferase [Defluviitaleaceae bacterium]